MRVAIIPATTITTVFVGYLTEIVQQRPLLTFLSFLSTVFSVDFMNSFCAMPAQFVIVTLLALVWWHDCPSFRVVSLRYMNKNHRADHKKHQSIIMCIITDIEWLLTYNNISLLRVYISIGSFCCVHWKWYWSYICICMHELQIDIELLLKHQLYWSFAQFSFYR